MKSIFCTVLILLAAAAAFAQEKTLTRTEFDAVTKSPGIWAPVRWKGKSYRMIMTTETKASGNQQIDSSSKSTILYASPAESHNITESRSGTKITKSESIRIGDKIYNRQENGAWIEAMYQNPSASKPPEPPTPSSSDTSSEKQYSYKYLGTEKLNDQTAKVYAEIIKTKSVDSSTNQEKSYTNTIKYWFGEDGILLKKDLLMESRSGTDTFYTRLVTAWEFDPTIKIKAPGVE